MLTHDAAITAWGGFFFEVKQEDYEEEWKVLDDDKCLNVSVANNPSAPAPKPKRLTAPSL